jgi:hypothetical protein
MKVTVESVATIGYPKWGLRFHKLKKWMGDKRQILIEIDVPWTQYEVRIYY